MEGHGVGTPVPASGHCVPLGQFMHASKPPPAYVPAAHVSEVAPSGHASPWGHGGGSIAPVAAQRLPAGHAAHAVWSLSLIHI